MTAEPSWAWWSLGIVAGSMIAAFVAIVLIGWLAQSYDRRRRPPA